MGLLTTLKKKVGTAAPVVYDSVRTAMGQSTGTSPSSLTISGPAGGCAEGDLITVLIRVQGGSLYHQFVYVGDSQEGEATLVVSDMNSFMEELQVWSYRCTGANSGAVTIQFDADPDMSEEPPNTAWACASRFTNISSATAHVSKANHGSSGTTYSTTPASTTTVKTVQIGGVLKHANSTGSWDSAWTNGQGVTNVYSEGYALNKAAGSWQTMKIGGSSSNWVALFAAFPVRTS